MFNTNNNNGNNISNGYYQTPLFTLGSINEMKNKGKKLVKRLLSKRSGYALIGLVFYLFIIGTLAIMDPMLTTLLELKAAWLHVARNRAENLAITTSSPIRARLVDDVYTRIQKQLIDHIAKSNGTAAYQCQGILTQPKIVDPVGGKLDGQFGLCQPENLLDGLSGLSNQTINFLDTIYPNYKTPLTGNNEVIRQAIVNQNQNSYEYKLTSTYVGQENINTTGAKSLKLQTGVARQERYRWLVRADSEATGFRNVIKPIVIYYDVILTNTYYPNNFGGGGNACDRNPDITPSPCPSASADPLLNECIQQGYTTSDGTYWEALGGPCPRYSTGDCAIIDKCVDHGAYVTCPLAGGGQSITMKVRSIRPQIGCASLNTGKSGKLVDSGGYSFVLTVRIVSIGNPYN